MTDVALTSGFWADLQRLNTTAMIPHGVDWVNRLDWTTNFSDAAAGRQYAHRGREFADSEIYKLIEAMSWDVARTGEADQHSALQELVVLIGSAQDPDGYLHTLFGRPWQSPRYSDFKWGHELYCFGHLIQAAVAHNRALGSDDLLQTAIRLADHICTMFGEHGLEKVCGHAEIEVALVELYRVTGTRRYLEQARIFVERRGTGTLPLFEFGAAYWQDDVRVRDAEVLRGHAVRALYLAAGAVDVAVELGDRELLHALELQWDNTVAKRTYITGGMGSHHMDEAFGDDFVLPPDRSYCETCAGVASIMFSWRLLLATGKAKYADLIERTLFNVVATSPGADGKSFFYANTLHQRTAHGVPALNEEGVTIRGGSAGRQAWFEVSCCPPNVARTLASLGAYVATTDADGLQVHQFASGTISAETPAGFVGVKIETEYPLSGRVRVIVTDAPEGGAAIRIRVPGWAAGATLEIPAGTVEVAPGYAVAPNLGVGDEVILDLPLAVRRSVPDSRIDAVRGTVAFERGPEVFALESIDLPEGWELDQVVVETTSEPYYDGRTVVIRATKLGLPMGRAWPFGSTTPDKLLDAAAIRLVRYHEWAERGSSEMRIFIPA
ncbi:glycoside hydrolase family 127 protein [Herbiconiux sp. CPCC 205716]|uniref:Glycoside hydrolase family 127 protein n=1 Tax=Herbiconiux gentiana TaxID=2970912 RepID=A0ABT2GJR2_9MICO|nr:glycoside hydrolase family 127 protein [Herbiconiux gentiana]MCS5716455.1 glycoside hydrolase family 127 protein [Herbiconiux gentiana]